MKASEELLKKIVPISCLRESGIYFLFQDDEVVYVGKTITGLSRFMAHVNNFGTQILK